MGYHLCYGSMNNRHWKEPDNLGMFVKVINELTKQIARPISFFHVPVPADRTDDNYYSPLKGIELDPATEIFLGLLHHAESVSGNEHRLLAASKFLDDFGIAMECGLGRRGPRDIVKILELHAQVSQQVHKSVPR